MLGANWVAMVAWIYVSDDAQILRNVKTKKESIIVVKQRSFLAIATECNIIPARWSKV
jgi:hypothetical protein